MQKSRKPCEKICTKFESSNRFGWRNGIENKSKKLPAKSINEGCFLFWIKYSPKIDNNPSRFASSNERSIWSDKMKNSTAACLSPCCLNEKLKLKLVWITSSKIHYLQVRKCCRSVLMVGIEANFRNFLRFIGIYIVQIWKYKKNSSNSK